LSRFRTKTKKTLLPSFHLHSALNFDLNSLVLNNLNGRILSIPFLLIVNCNNTLCWPVYRCSGVAWFRIRTDTRYVPRSLVGRRSCRTSQNESYTGPKEPENKIKLIENIIVTDKAINSIFTVQSVNTIFFAFFNSP
jgi:hypothetical protein